MKKYPLALFIGRFQPFHKGHLYSLKKAFQVGEKVIVGIGSSNVHDTNNPWDYETRRRMVEEVVRENGWDRKLQAVWAVPDVYDDEKWGRGILESLREEGVMPGEVLAVGNNEWTNRILKARGITVYESGLYKREELEGVKIRELLAVGDNSWQKRLPEAVVKYVEGAR